MSELFDFQKQWEQYTADELVRISKMLGSEAYGSIVLNMNDVFGYACAHGIELDQWDLLTTTELYEKFGPSGVVAWCAIKENIDDPIEKFRFPKFDEAKKEIQSNLTYYYWDKKLTYEKTKKI